MKRFYEQVNEWLNEGFRVMLRKNPEGIVIPELFKEVPIEVAPKPVDYAGWVETSVEEKTY